VQERILDSTYRLLEEIGRGGFGAVWRAVRLGAEGSGAVAIKLLSRGSVLSHQEQLRFQREATLMSQLLHPGTVTVYELGESEGRAYIVMEYVDGPNLRDYVRGRGGRLPLLEILGVLIQAAEALEYVHGHNIVHRDIKPQNILVSNAKDGSDSKIQVKIVDFGVARLNDPVRQNADLGKNRSEVVGTLSYMAPESTGMVNWPVDARADIYSLGIVAYELICGRTPFHEYRNEDLLRAHLEKQPPSFSKLDGMRVPDVLERIVMKCIEKRPEDRYQSMFGLLSDFRRLQENMRSQRFDEFDIATKDLALSRIFNSIFVGRGELVEQVVGILGQRQKRSRVTWSMIRSSVGLGRTRCLSEVRRRLDEQKIPFLHIRFTESEQRLPLRAFSLAINEQLQALEIRSPHIFQNLMQELALIAGSGATEVARLIPALRPHLIKGTTSTTLSVDVERHDEEPDPEGRLEALELMEDNLNPLPSGLPRTRKVAQVRVPIQQIFSELLAKIAQQDGSLVFLLDDLHLADNQSIGLFQFITERVNDQASFAFVMTMREGIARTNFVLENFLARLSNLRRRFHVWDLAPLTQYDFMQFLQSAGLQRPTPKFVEFVTAKCDGSPLLLHQLLKQMVETEALVPERKNFNPWAPTFRVDWAKLSQIVVDTRNIEALLASLDRLDKRDQRLTSIAAVSHEACEFEYFRVEQDFTSVELETRLLSLVRRGVFEMMGDENLPVQRRSFVFSHEKLRSAVLAGLDQQVRRQIHLALANRIIYLYPKPRREHVLSLAKHFEGAGTLADAERSSTIFLKAARLHARNFEHPLAKYYTERAMQRASTISNQQERLTRLREVFETEYTIHIAQNELVAASDVCQQLVALTFEPGRKEILQLHWAHLLLGLGRHRMAFEQVADAIDRKLTFPFGKFNRFITESFEALAAYGFVAVAFALSGTRLLRKEKPNENHIQGLMYLALAQAHGADGTSLGYLIAAIRMNLHRTGPTRSFAIFNMLIAAHCLKHGHIDRAFEIAETLERAMESNGRVDIARWVRALRVIWLDYPMGRMERLARVLDERKDGQLPSSGVLNIESNAVRSWVRTTSPRVWRSRREEILPEEKARPWPEKNKVHPGGYVSERLQRSKKFESRPAAREFSDQPISNHTSVDQNSNEEVLFHSRQVRKMREASENGQYTGLSLFSDALRFALSDRVDPLRRTVDQFARQRSGVIEGAIFKSLSLALQDFSSGQYKDALESYIEAMRLFMRRKDSEISLPVSDALRMGFIILPLLAFSVQSRGWPWGKSLARLLREVDARLTLSEGRLNPRRTPITPMYQGVLQFLEGEGAKALRILGIAKDHAKSAQNDLAACIVQQFMGLCCSTFDQVRAMDYFAECYRSAHDLGWRMMERQLLALCRKLNLPLQHHFPELLAESEKINFRRRAAGVGLSHIVESWLIMKREPQTVNHYINQSARIAAKVLSSPLCLLFLRIPGEKGILQPSVQWLDDGNLFLQTLSDAPLGPKALEVELVKNLPRFHDVPVRLVPLDGRGGETLDGRTLQFERSEQEQAEFFAVDQNISTRIVDMAVTNTQMRTQHVGVEANRSPTDVPYAVYIALKYNDEFLGWMAVGRVPLSQFTSNDAELELILLALHTAFNLNHEELLAKAIRSNSRYVLEPLKPRATQLPLGLTVEQIGRLRESNASGSQVHSISQHRGLIVNWQIDSAAPSEAVVVGGLFTHYMGLLVESLRVFGDSIPLDKFSLRFSADVGGLLERVALTQRFERVRITAILVDTHLKEAQECVFGQEQLSFSGGARVERELLLELGGVLRLDRLVYRERRRIMTSLRYAWLLSHDQRFRDIVPQFSKAGFLDEYVSLRKNRGLDLSRVLNQGELPADFNASAIIIDASESEESAA
jgi:serine/threonine protein kinase